MFHRLFAALVAAAFVVMGTAGMANAKTTLKMATLAPPRSPWGVVFKTWAKAIKQKTKGETEVDWLWNGTGGPEDAVVGKIKSGQIAGSALTAVGLSAIDKRFLALQMPGAFSSWKDLDRARDKYGPELSKAAAKDGFEILGWGDIGQGKVLSKGSTIAVPADLKGKRPGAIAGDIIAPKVYEAIGGITSVSSSVVGFTSKLNAKAINVMNTPSLAAEQLQWAPLLDHITTGTTYYGIGAVVMSKKELDKMPADQRAVVVDTGKLAAKALTKRIRKADDKAFGRLKKKMTVHETTKAEEAEWKRVFKKACERLKGAIPGGALSKVGAC
ncbi:MAG: TRAP transporter substrate-binding protein DctP [Myxococcales bacterium]|nr:TRAP transporter substrate-binding protein DctP [Myxococcales bacterium]MCB9583060.1 TRAP transporter substrate-binding protein DctP [Polyangiaceae bacterium]